MKPSLNLQFDRLIFIVIISLVLIMAARVPLDSDLWWHLRAGEWTVQHATPMVRDYFSHTAAGNPWINHSWLAEVIFYLVYQAAGFWGIALSVCLLAAGSMIFVYRQMEGNAFTKALLIVLASAVAAFVWVPRPEMFSLLLLGWLGYVLYEFKWRQNKFLWQLPIIFLLWGNLHGGYPLGLLLILATLGGETLNIILGFEGREIFAWREIFELGGWGLLSMAVLLVNPNGFQILVVPFQTIGMPILQQLIQEWASPDFHDISQQVFLLAIFAGVFFVGISGRRLDGSDAFVFLGFAYLAFVARRNFGPFAVAAIPVLSRHIQPALEAWLARVRSQSGLVRGWMQGNNKDLGAAQPSLPARLRVIINIALITLLGLAFIVKIYWVSDNGMIQQTIKDSNPVGAVTWLEANKPEGKLLNEYNSGGYLVWALRDYPVFVDGRTDMYGEGILQDWMNLVQAGKDSDGLMKKYDIGIVMVDPGRPLVNGLVREGWRKAYEDTQAVILLPK